MRVNFFLTVPVCGPRNLSIFWCANWILRFIGKKQYKIGMELWFEQDCHWAIMGFVHLDRGSSEMYRCHDNYYLVFVQGAIVWWLPPMRVISLSDTFKAAAARWRASSRWLAPHLNTSRIRFLSSYPVLGIVRWHLLDCLWEFFFGESAICLISRV